MFVIGIIHDSHQFSAKIKIKIPLDLINSLDPLNKISKIDLLA